MTDLFQLIHALAARWEREADVTLQAACNIGISQYRILQVLDERPVYQQRELAVELGQTEASISRQIKLLQKNGLITNQVNPNNRREHVLKLSARGRQLTARAADVIAVQAPLTVSLSLGEQRQLVALLKKAGA